MGISQDREHQPPQPPPTPREHRPDSRLGIVRRRLTSLYTALKARRDWVLGRIEYLQGESARWRTLFATLRAPYTLLRSMGLSPQAAMSLLFAGSVATTGVVVNETLLDGPSFRRGDAGVYEAPGDAPVLVDGSNTLRIDLGTTPVGEISIEDITIAEAYVGSQLPTGETNAVFVGGLPFVGTSTYLEVGHLTVDRWRCDELRLEDSEVYELNVKFNASDGQSISPVPGTPRARGIGGGNRADGMATSGGYYDQVKIQAPTTGVNGQVDVMWLSNFYSSGGPCVLSRIKAGILDILYNEVGEGDGFALKDFIIATSTTYKTLTLIDNVEEGISPP